MKSYKLYKDDGHSDGERLSPPPQPSYNLAKNNKRLKKLRRLFLIILKISVEVIV